MSILRWNQKFLDYEIETNKWRSRITAMVADRMELESKVSRLRD